jgi:hypothetical protein
MMQLLNSRWGLQRLLIIHCILECEVTKEEVKYLHGRQINL